MFNPSIRLAFYRLLAQRRLVLAVRYEDYSPTLDYTWLLIDLEHVHSVEWFGATHSPRYELFISGQRIALVFDTINSNASIQTVERYTYPWPYSDYSGARYNPNKTKAEYR